MVSGLVIFHIIVCILLTIVVLVQFGKGAEAGAMMGGGGSSQAVFTSSAKGNFFTKMTTVLAITFMVTSVALTTLNAKTAKKSLLDDEAPVASALNSDVLAVPKADAAKKETKTEAPKAEATKSE